LLVSFRSFTFKEFSGQSDSQLDSML